MKVPSIENRSVLVTGCSSGIGRATAEMLRSVGWRVFPTARAAADL
ncbi:SDR family NAD(P)-dependent oxidoreductase, partial [Pontiella sp.]